MSRFRAPKLNLEFQPGTTSHLDILIDFVRRTNGNVLELGMGPGSTLVLHELCRGRRLVSYDNNKAFIDAFAGFKSNNHEIYYTDDWAKADLEKDWSVVFVDHAPARRRRYDIVRLKDFAHYVIVHDTERDVDRFYFYTGAFSLYKYRKDYTNYKPYTTVLSNKHAL